MFRGNSFHSLDSKGRLIIPARFRDVLGQSSVDGLMISRMDRALVCYSFEEWRKIEDRIQGISVKSEQMRRFRRMFIGGAFECPLDKQGRILIPPPLREYAGLDKDVVLVGVVGFFEVWSLDRWQEEADLHEADLKNESLRAEIASLGL